MGKKKSPLYREIDDILNAIYQEEEVDANFNDFLSYDYSYVENYLKELGYSLKGSEGKERMLTLLAGVLSDLEDDEDISGLEDTVLEYAIDELVEYDPKEIESCPYYSLLKKVKPFKKGDVSFEYRNIDAYTPFLCKNREFNEDYRVLSKPNLGFFSSPYSQPLILKGEDIWMSLIPHEIETMKEPFSHFEGNVLIYGLGLGYAAYMASICKNVTSVTIVEKDKLILDLFKERMLPLFENKEKIHLIHDDAISFAETNKKECEFDFLFADLWRTGEDGLELYAKLKKQEGAAKINRYWIEEEIYIYLRRLYARYLAAIIKNDPAYIEDLKGSPYYETFLSLYQNNKDIHLNSPIADYLDKKSLDSLMNQLF